MVLLALNQRLDLLNLPHKTTVRPAATATKKKKEAKKHMEGEHAPGGPTAPSTPLPLGASRHMRQRRTRSLQKKGRALRVPSRTSPPPSAQRSPKWRTHRVRGRDVDLEGLVLERSNAQPHRHVSSRRTAGPHNRQQADPLSPLSKMLDFGQSTKTRRGLRYAVCSRPL